MFSCVPKRARRCLSAGLSTGLVVTLFSITSASGQEAEELPSVEVIQEKSEPDAAPKPAKPKQKQTAAKARPAPKTNAKPKTRAKASPQPATVEPAPQAPFDDTATTADANSAASDSGDIRPGTRSGALTAPTLSEARAQIETTPGAVDLVPAEDYAQSTPATTLKDALDYVPGVFVQPKWGEDTRLSIRGSGLSRNFHGRGVSLLMDGVIPISTADGASDFQEIDPTAYRYIEVFKGANALQFGANSLGGAINFVMPTGRDTAGSMARVDVGSFGLYKLAATTGGVAGPMDYFISGTWQEQDGFRDHSDGTSTRGAMNIGYRLSENVETRFYLNANHVRQNIPGAVTRQEALTTPERAFVRPGEPGGFLGVGNDNVDRDYERNLDTFRVANKTAVRVAPGTLVEFGGFYFNRELDHPILLIIDNKHDEFGGFAKLTDESSINGYRNRLTTGVSVHNGNVRARTFRNVLGERGAMLSDADQTSRVTTVYAENAFYPTDDFAIVAGAQFAHVTRKLDDNFLANGDESRSRDFDLWSPKVGFLWDIARNAQIFGNISKSREAPTFNEIPNPTAVVPILDAQEATTFEIGTRGSQPGLRWDLSLYRSHLKNEFQCNTVADGSRPGSCDQINLDKTIHQGVEAGLALRLFEGTLFSGRPDEEVWLNTAYTFSDFRFDGDATYGNNDLPGAPRHFVRAELLYKHPSGVYVGPNVEWVPEAYFVDSMNTLKSEDYALLGAKIGFDNGGPITAYLEGRNLTDEAYIASANVTTLAAPDSPLFEPGNGRAIYGGIQVRW